MRVTERRFCDVEDEASAWVCPPPIDPGRVPVSAIVHTGALGEEFHVAEQVRFEPDVALRLNLQDTTIPTPAASSTAPPSSNTRA